MFLPPWAHIPEDLRDVPFDELGCNDVPGVGRVCYRMTKEEHGAVMRMHRHRYKKARERDGVTPERDLVKRLKQDVAAAAAAAAARTRTRLDLGGGEATSTTHTPTHPLPAAPAVAARPTPPPLNVAALGALQGTLAMPAGGPPASPFHQACATLPLPMYTSSDPWLGMSLSPSIAPQPAFYGLPLPLGASAGPPTHAPTWPPPQQNVVGNSLPLGALTTFPLLGVNAGVGHTLPLSGGYSGVGYSGYSSVSGGYGGVGSGGVGNGSTVAPLTNNETTTTNCLLTSVKFLTPFSHCWQQSHA